MPLIQFERLEFVDRSGIVRTFYGCSLIGVFEFDERIQELRGILLQQPEEVGAETLYRSDLAFRHVVNRCLDLNGINPDWLTWPMLAQLLLGRLDDQGKPQPGYLIELNRPHEPKRKRKAGEAVSSKAAMVAAIASHCGLDEALKLADSIPARELLAILEEKREQAKTPEEKKKEGFDDWVQKKRAEHRAGVVNAG